ncbi:hypothetical protein JHK87_000976 [Glycine soja]|nr:hypothetical protein JHK87_000976 [Glycine soja]
MDGATLQEPAPVKDMQQGLDGGTQGLGNTDCGEIETWRVASESLDEESNMVEDISSSTETTDSLLDDENELSYGVDDSAHDISIGYVDLGDASKTCAYCQATMWYQERTRKNRNQANAKYSL